MASGAQPSYSLDGLDAGKRKSCRVVNCSENAKKCSKHELVEKHTSHPITLSYGPTPSDESAGRSWWIEHRLFFSRRRGPVEHPFAKQERRIKTNTPTSPSSPEGCLPDWTFRTMACTTINIPYCARLYENQASVRSAGPAWLFRERAGKHHPLPPPAPASSSPPLYTAAFFVLLFRRAGRGHGRHSRGRGALSTGHHKDQTAVLRRVSKVRRPSGGVQRLERRRGGLGAWRCAFCPLGGGRWRFSRVLLGRVILVMAIIILLNGGPWSF